MASPEPLEVPPLHRTLETLTDPSRSHAISILPRKQTRDTYEFAMTSTNCPGTKCIADRVVPAYNGELSTSYLVKYEAHQLAHGRPA